MPEKMQSSSTVPTRNEILRPATWEKSATVLAAFGSPLGRLSLRNSLLGQTSSSSSSQQTTGRGTCHGRKNTKTTLGAPGKYEHPKRTLARGQKCIGSSVARLSLSAPLCISVAVSLLPIEGRSSQFRPGNPWLALSNTPFFRLGQKMTALGYCTESCRIPHTTSTGARESQNADIQVIIWLI